MWTATATFKTNPVHIMEHVLILSSIVASISFTITSSGIFKPVREWVSTWHQKIDDLIHCPYCLGHWVAFGTLVIIDDLPVHYSEYWFINFLLSAFAIVGVASLMHYVMLRAYEPVAKLAMFRELEKAKAKA